MELTHTIQTLIFTAFGLICWGAGMLADLQFNNCTVTNRTKLYQPASTGWHYLLWLGMVGSAVLVYLLNPHAWLPPLLVFLWICSTLYMGISQHKAAKEKGQHRPWYAVGDGKGNPEENLYWGITWLVSGFKKPSINRMAVVSVFVRAIVLLASVLWPVLKYQFL